MQILQDEMESLEGKLKVANATVSKLKGDNLELRRLEMHQTEEIKHLQAQLAALQNELEELQQERQALLAQKKELTEQIKALQDRIEDAGTRARADSTAMLDDADVNLAKMKQQRDELRVKRDKLQNELEALQHQMGLLETEKAAGEAREQQLQEEFVQMGKEGRKVKAEADRQQHELEEQIRQLQAELADAYETFGATKTKLEKNNLTIAALEKKLKDAQISAALTSLYGTLFRITAYNFACTFYWWVQCARDGALARASEELAMMTSQYHGGDRQVEVEVYTEEYYPDFQSPTSEMPVTPSATVDHYSLDTLDIHAMAAQFGL